MAVLSFRKTRLGCISKHFMRRYSSMYLGQSVLSFTIFMFLAGLHAKLKGKHGDGYEKKSCAVCSGLDMVKIHLLNIIFKDEGTAEVSETTFKFEHFLTVHV